MQIDDLIKSEHRVRNIQDLLVKVLDNKDGRLLLEYLGQHKFSGKCDLLNTERTYYELGKRDAIGIINEHLDKAVARIEKETKELKHGK